MKENMYFKGLITVLVVIIGISGIGWFTWHLGRMFVGLVTSSSQDTLAEIQPTGSQVLNLPEIKLWTCQIGVYKDRKNAELQVDSLKHKGWKAAIIKEEPFTIAIGSFAEKGEAVLLGDILTKEGIQSWAREESFPALNYKVSGKNVEGVTRILILTNSLLCGAERNKVQAELAGDIEVISADSCPSAFTKLNQILSKVLTIEYERNDLKCSYNQDLLEMFVEYKLVTTKFFLG